MTVRGDICERLAALFTYPRAEYRGALQECHELMITAHPQAAETMETFVAAAAALDSNGLEELFTRTFDLNPVCCPEIGWHLFGERYERGSFLVWMRSQLRRYDIAETTELPDHLMYTLRVLARKEDDEADRFATEAILPALERMLGSLKGKSNPYEGLLQAARDVLVSYHGPAKEDTSPLIQVAKPDGSLVEGRSKG